MRIVELTAYHVRIPLRHPVRHALAERHGSDNLVVCCLLADATQGWGEGVPREYVTGETIAGAFDQLAASDLLRQLSEDCRSYGDAVEMTRGFRMARVPDDPRQMRGNAARCAVELAVLDAFGRHFGQPLAAVVELIPQGRDIGGKTERVRYSGAITADTAWRERVSAWKMRLYGFRQCKLKVAVAGQDDVARVTRVRRVLGRQVDLRVDANGGWRADEAPRRIAALAPADISAVEQPVAHDEVETLPSIRRQVATPIMLDESLCSASDAQRAVNEGLCDLFNIRLSKCGGFLPALQLAALARRNGLGYQLGCQVGETGILSAAGRHFACSVGQIRYLEGSYDRHLVRERLTREDVTFGYGGWAPALRGLGLGVAIDRGRAESLSLRRAVWRNA